MLRLLLCLAAAALISIAPSADAQPRPAPAPTRAPGSGPQQPPAATVPPQLDRLPQRADGATVVPDRFLRRWDPVTVFFDRDLGPAQGGPEDAPERLVTLNPATPGAWQWLGPRALQFRPAEPWQPLRRVTFAILGGGATRLVPLLPTPTETSPADRAEGIADLDTIGLTFPDPVDPAALARLMTIELRGPTGAADPAAPVLTARDFEIKPLERAARDAPQTLLVVLRRPVPDGRTVLLHLRLADEPGLDAPSFELRLRSAVAFTLADTSCAPGFWREMQEAALRCTPHDGGPAARRGLTLRFSEEPETAVDVLRAREILRITPPVEDLTVAPSGRSWRVTGRFLADTTYTLRIEPGSVKDRRGRALEGAAILRRFTFLPDRPALRWDASQGIVERRGPQMVPLRGRGYERADLRIHAIDPLARDFWPFPAGGVQTEDDAAPPLPGNEPRPWSEAAAIRRDAMAQRLRALGSPAVSELVTLPTQRGGAEAKFGLDIRPHLARIGGEGQPGAYLLGLRPIDGGPRRWMRVQVTDLVLSTIEEAERVRFAVTSLADARPVEGAEIRLEGERGDVFVTLTRGLTGADGGFTWAVPSAAPATAALRGQIRRIVVTKGNDVLVLEPNRAPPQYSAENWTRPGEPWLSWSQSGTETRRERPQTLCHLFTERPIYRPEEPVHIQGFVRRYLGGGLGFARGGGTLVVSGPDDQEWRIPVALDEVGGFHHLFEEPTTATGEYGVRFEPDSGRANRDDAPESCGETPFKKEAYRLPTFEVLLNGPVQGVPLDAPFDVDLLARYFAGGLAADRPLRWRVTQFPHNWSPPAREGFLFSTDARFSSMGEFRSTPVLERGTRTDAAGAARLTLDPTIEPTAQSRRYVIEATVTGDDDIQVRSTQTVVALPPFLLGLKVPRYLPQPGAIGPEVLVTDAEGRPQAGIAVTARLIRRNWTSVLQASDFSQGSARYVTEVIDETVEERRLASTEEAQRLRFEAREAGVYIVELEAEDRIGRRQSVRVDLFMAGDTPVTWSRAPAQTVTVTPDKPSYTPGETATLLIQSPFQTARALVIVEEPGGRFRYDWVDVANGFGRYAVPIRREQMPRLAVHFLLMRGRLAEPPQAPTAPFDQGKPVTLAATSWLTVSQATHRVAVSLTAPQTARPAEEIEVVLRLADERGRPLAGEAAFWMVDQAVLSLAREQPLDPLPRFVMERPTRMAARDTRNMAFGVIPLEENPGGDEAAEEWGIENIAVRRNFTPVPIYLPRVRVGPDGVARIRVRLPDTLTVYRLRAKAISGPDRFGHGVGEIRIRQPVVAQAALPRFLRPGDRFDAAAIARIVEGPGGAGRARLDVEGGLRIEGAAEQNFAWAENRPARLEFGLSAADSLPAATAGGGTARLRFLLQRNADRAGDAVQLDLPVRPDRPPLRRHEILEVAAGGSVRIAPPPVAVRPGSYAASLTLASDPALVRLLGGLNALVAYPYGCTEQRIALASAELALQPFAPLLETAGLKDRMAADLRATQQWIQQATDEDGLVAFWPRGRGSVLLTSWAYRLLAAAKRAELPVDPAQMDRLAQVLTRALRSDSAALLRGEELRERVAALIALAEGGQAQPAYVAELIRRAAQMPTETLAQAIAAAALLPEAERPTLAGAMETLWGRVRVLARDGRPTYAGLAEIGAANPLVLPSETRSLAEVTLAVAQAAPEEPRLALLREALLGLGGPEGWGSTNADAAALRALAAGGWAAAGAEAVAAVALPGGQRSETGGRLDAATPLRTWRYDTPGPAQVENRGTVPLLALAEQRWLPAEPGAAAQPVSQGFVLTRTLFRIPQGGGPAERLAPGPDGAIRVAVGEVIEEVAELANPEDRVHVALRLPIAAGLEPLNPNLATAPAEATPSAPPSTPPSWAAYRDDEMVLAWTTLARGNHRLAFRMRATFTGTYTQPPGEAEMMYRPGVYGASAGARVLVVR